MNNNWFHGESEESQRMLRTFDYLYEFIEENSDNPKDDLERFQELCVLINGRKYTKRSALIMRRMMERKSKKDGPFDFSNRCKCGVKE